MRHAPHDAMIQLTDLGWIGASSGTWTPGPDTVQSRSTATQGAPIKLKSTTRAVSQAGDDRVSARVALGRALILAGTLELADGQDVLTGVSLGGQGIRNIGLVDLGPGDDRIIAAGVAKASSTMDPSSPDRATTGLRSAEVACTAQA